MASLPPAREALKREGGAVDPGFDEWLPPAREAWKQDEEMVGEAEHASSHPTASGGLVRTCQVCQERIPDLVAYGRTELNGGMVRVYACPACFFTDVPAHDREAYLRETLVVVRHAVPGAGHVP